jgi:hypothetical protein
MSAKTVLGLIVRIFGLMLAALGIYSAFYTLVHLLGFLKSAQYTTAEHCLFGTAYFVGSLMTLRNADRIAEFAYSFDKKNPVEPPPASND